jgi:UDP-N-acetylmuramoyl-L-alanyl-D-glutamate--2,6-diaminopimelate ligase
MTLRDLLKVAEIQATHGDLDQPVIGLSYDSRKVQPGFVFFGLPGTYSDGTHFALEAIGKGACAVVLDRKIELPEDAAWVLAHDIRYTMGKWAAEFFGQPSQKITVVGVTGTNGKTTVTYLLESIFRAAGMAPGVIGTINYRYQSSSRPAPHTTPESIDLQQLLGEMVQSGTQSVAMEVSSHALALERVRGIAFDGALFTNLTRDHLDFHRDMEDYFLAKCRLFTDYLLDAPSKKRRFAVIHGGDPKGKLLLEKSRQIGLDVWSYGLDRKWDLHPLEFEADLGGLRGVLEIKGQSFGFESPLIGIANLENILCSVGAASALGLPSKAIVEGIARLEPVPGRLEKIKNSLGITVLVDYAHTPDALEKAMSSLRPLTQGRLIVVFGCGGDRDAGKRPIMGEIAARLSEVVILTSDNPRTETPQAILRQIEEGLRNMPLTRFTSKEAAVSSIGTATSYCVEADRRAAIALALRIAQPKDLVLIAGKGHEDYQILGKERIRFDDREVVREELRQLTS